MPDYENIIHVYENESSMFGIGSKYVLFLEFFESSLYPHTIYNTVYDSVFKLKPDDKIDSIMLATKDLSDLFSNKHDIIKYIDSVDKGYNINKPTNTTELVETDDLNELIAKSDYIFMIKPKQITFENSYLKMATCNVTKNYKNKLMSEVVISIPANAELEKEYLVLLKEVDGGSYTIASRYHSFISKEEKKEIDKMLKAMKQNGIID